MDFNVSVLRLRPLHMTVIERNRATRFRSSLSRNSLYNNSDAISVKQYSDP